MTLRCSPLVLALSLSLSAPLTAQEPGDVPVTWSGKDTTLGALPAPVVEKLAPTLQHWLPWSQLSEYRTLIEKEGRAVLLTRATGAAAKKQQELMTKTVEAFEKLLPAQERDPNEDFLEAEWGVGEQVPDREPVVLVELDKTAHFASLLDHVGHESPRMASWAASQKNSTGFVSDGTLSAAWLSAPPDLELGDVWRPENELVHRMSRMLLRRRFGDQPYWFKVAVSWRMEQEVLGDIYCFPGREEFVGVGQHVGWEIELKQAFKKRKEALRASEFVEWSDGTWNAESAAVAWGVVTFLAEHRPEALPQIAEDYRRLHKKGARVVYDDGRWELRPTYSIPVDDQEGVLESRGGEGVLEEMRDFFRTGKRWKPAKKKR